MAFLWSLKPLDYNILYYLSFHLSLLNHLILVILIIFELLAIAHIQGSTSYLQLSHLCLRHDSMIAIKDQFSIIQFQNFNLNLPYFEKAFHITINLYLFCQDSSFQDLNLLHINMQLNCLILYPKEYSFSINIAIFVIL